MAPPVKVVFEALPKPEVIELVREIGVTLHGNEENLLGCDNGIQEHYYDHCLPTSLNSDFWSPDLFMRILDIHDPSQIWAVLVVPNESPRLYKHPSDNSGRHLKKMIMQSRHAFAFREIPQIHLTTSGQMMQSIRQKRAEM